MSKLTRSGHAANRLTIQLSHHPAQTRVKGTFTNRRYGWRHLSSDDAMPSPLQSAIEFIRSYKAGNRSANKASIQESFIHRFRPAKMRSVYVGDGYALRLSEARTGSFSNTVLSLSALQAHDVRPLVVVVVRDRSVDFLLANSTFLRKISHGSHKLRINNIKGSFNGTDIVTEYEGVTNAPENFEHLFAQHSAFTWAENVARLVEATNLIVGRDSRFRPTDAERTTLLAAPERAKAALRSRVFQEVAEELRVRVEDRRRLILEAASINNVNLRGNAIEQILTGDLNPHELGDLLRNLDGGRLIIDIKTKLLDRASAPKAYNIDKMLTFLAEPGSVLAFLMVGVSVSAAIVRCRLLPIFDNAILDATGVQHHWAGRVSRGVTQLSGRFGRVIEPNYQPTVNVARARSFLERLLAL